MKKRIIPIVLIVAVLAVAGFFAARMLMTGNQVNVSWYSDDETEFIIETADQLYELAELSEKKDLTGKTFKLGADIVVNEGNAEDWATDAPERKWYPIENFAGTFDGQGHTISGLYGSMYDKAMGLFLNTKPTAVIQDFKLVNTYFRAIGSPGTAAIAGGIKNSGTFDKIYTDAIIDCDGKYTAGIISFVTGGDATVTECWFDGSIQRYYYNHTGGGIVAQVNAATLTIEHCLFSGTIVNDEVKSYARVGGICGVIGSGGKLKATDCLSVGSIESPTTNQVGSIIGLVGETSTAKVDTVFASLNSYGIGIGIGDARTEGGIISFTDENLTGYNAYKWTNLDFENYWAVVEDSTPILGYFADEKLSTDGVAKMYDTSWFTGDADEYVITTKEQMYGFALLSSAHDFEGITIKLGADIALNEGDASKWTAETEADLWIPILNFGGTFDGQMHTISGIYLTGSGVMGLFQKTQKDSVVKNFYIKNSYFNNTSTANAYMGSVAGSAGGEFSTIYSDAIMTSTGYGVGGIVGYMNAGMPKITNCWYDGKITMLTDNGYSAGGIAGFAVAAGNIEHCLNSGTITAERKDKWVRLGGILGVAGSDSMMDIKDCLNVGTIDGFNKQVGSVLGFVGSKASVALDTICTTNESYLVAVGQASGALTGLPIQYNASDLIGYGGYQWTNLDFTNYWAAVKNGTPILKSFATSSLSTKGVAKKFDLSWYNEGKKSYTISDAADLYGVSILAGAGVTFEGKTLKLGADIAVNTGDASTWGTNPPTDSWIPITGFAGTFDGQMHTISGLYKNGGTNVGLFAKTEGTTVVKNLILENSYFANKTATGNVYIGGIAGQGGGKFDTIYSDVIIETTGVGAAGIIACVNKENASIKNCWVAGEISLLGQDAHSAGGMAAIIQKNATVESCLNSGELSAERTGKYARTAGIIGVIGSKAVVKIKDALNVGQISSAKNQAGSLIGFIGTTASATLDTDVYVTSDSYSTAIGLKSGTLNGSVNSVSETSIKSSKAKTNASGLDFDKYWMTLSKRTPILKSFASKAPALAGGGMTAETSWYTGTSKEYVLTKPEQLYGLEELSYDTDFKGITIKLGADITVNTGDAFTWGSAAPKYVWYPIQTFAGTFDGQGHTISGLYNVDGKNTGLIGETTTTSVVKDLRIENSYFANKTATGAVNIGGVAGKGGGTFDTIYVDTIIETTGNTIGGIIASVNTVSDKNIIRNCWFAGKLILTGENAHTAGGIVGEVGVATSSNPVVPGSLTVENCLVDNGSDEVQITSTGRIGSKNYLRTGGVCGIASKKGSALTMTDCLVLGKIKTEGTVHVGSIAGYITADPKASVDGVYTSTESYKDVFGKASVSGVSSVEEAKYIGKGAFTTAGGLDYTTYWAAIEGKTPILRSFLGNETALEAEKYDTSWYTTTEEGASFVITTESQLFGLAELSKTYDFKGQTIYLGADIRVNTLPEGKTAEYWLDDANAPEKIWTPIGSDVAFAGTFDGCYEDEIHTISGLYTEGGTNVGLFAKTTVDSTIQNLRLVDSCFVNHSSTGQVNIGSIVGRGAGKIDTVYTDAIISTTGTTIGGIIASVVTVSDKNIVNNCWFAGKLFLTGSSAHTAGGVVGEVGEATASAGGTLTIQNCLVDAGLNSDGSRVAQITSTGRTGYLRIGGLCGIASKSGTNLILSDNVILGTINSSNNNNVGSIIGYRAVSITYSGDVYVLESSFSKTSGNTKNGTTATGEGTYLHTIADESMLYGWNAVKNASGLDYGTAWAPIEGETPVLWSFKGDKTIATEPEDEPTAPAEPKEITEYDAADTVTTTYTIKNVEQLDYFANLSKTNSFEGKTIRLVDDISVNELSQGETVKDWATRAPSKSWTPIGTSEKPFAGTFDGQGYIISGLYSSSETEGNIGLFGYTAASCVIKDFELKNCYFKGTAFIGGVAAQGGGTFEKINSEVDIVCTAQYAGGIIAYVNAESEISNCQFGGSIIGTKTQYASTTNGAVKNTGTEAGGMVGRAQDVSLTIKHCLNSGTITSVIDKNDRIGGICGLRAGSATVSIEDCLNVGAMTSTCKGDQCNAIIGFYGSGVTLTNVYALDQEDNANKFGYKKDASAFTNCGYLSSDKLLGEAFKENTALSEDYWMAQENATPILAAFYWYQPDATRSVIDNLAEFYVFVKLASAGNDFAGQTICLGANIEVNVGTVEQILATNNPTVWTPIGTKEVPFAGTFDGQGHTISGLYYSSETEGNIGLFGYTAASCVIKDFELKNCYFKGTASIGGVAAQGGGTFEKINSEVDIVCTAQYAGGIIAYVNAESEISNCQYSGSITGTKTNYASETNGAVKNTGTEAGGMVGRAQDASLTIKHCLNSGTITSVINKNDRIGGICGLRAGSATVSIEDCLNVGAMTSTCKGDQCNAIIGFYGGGVTLTNVYALDQEDNAKKFGYKKDASAFTNCGYLSSDKLSGDAFKTNTTLSENYWIAGTDYPVLKEFN